MLLHATAKQAQGTGLWRRAKAKSTPKAQQRFCPHPCCRGLAGAIGSVWLLVRSCRHPVGCSPDAARVSCKLCACCCQLSLSAYTKKSLKRSLSAGLSGACGVGPPLCCGLLPTWGTHAGGGSGVFPGSLCLSLSAFERGGAHDPQNAASHCLCCHVTLRLVGKHSLPCVHVPVLYLSMYVQARGRGRFVKQPVRLCAPDSCRSWCCTCTVRWPLPQPASCTYRQGV